MKIQNCFCHHELKTYIESVLETEAIPADIGIFYVFKDEAADQQFLASRYRRAAAAPRKRISEVRFEENRELLEPFMATIAASGGCRRRMNSRRPRKSRPDSDRSSERSPW